MRKFSPKIQSDPSRLVLKKSLTRQDYLSASIMAKPEDIDN